jgi:hypothetical protein
MLSGLSWQDMASVTPVGGAFACCPRYVAFAGEIA